MEKSSEKGKEYQKKKQIVSFASLVIMIVSLLIFVVTPASVGLREFVEGWSGNVWVVIATYFFLFSLILFFIDLPLNYFSGFHVEHQYGLSNLTLAGWAREMLKRQTLSFLMAILFVELLYAIIRAWPVKWWIIAWAAWAIISAILSKLWPILIAPLFYKYERLANEELRRRILDLVKKVNLTIENVYSMNLSKTTKKANAFFAGLGSTRRVVLSDTLLRSFTPEEITVVVAHEAGHCKHRHILKEIVFGMLTSFLIFWLAYRCLMIFSSKLGLESASDVAGFPLLCLVGMLVGLVLLPLGNIFSRALERQADDFALRTTQMRDAFISAMKKLALLNLSDPNPHPLIEFLLYSHPSVDKRIARAEALPR